MSTPGQIVLTSTACGTTYATDCIHLKVAISSNNKKAIFNVNTIYKKIFNFSILQFSVGFFHPLCLLCFNNLF